MNYAYFVWCGDDNGERTANGNVWWARCWDTGDLSHGDTPQEALESCQGTVAFRLEGYEENKVPLPPFKPLPDGILP